MGHPDVVPPLLWSRCRELVHFGNRDESRRIVIEGFRDGLHSVDSYPLKCPFVVVGDTRDRLLAMRLALLIFYMLAVIVTKSEHKVAGLDVARPALSTGNIRFPR